MQTILSATNQTQRSARKNLALVRYAMIALAAEAVAANNSVC
jgi:hypothetical protein